MTDPLEANREAWNHWTRRHVDAPFYDVAGFRRGRDTLMPLERAALGDVTGCSLLHLQCHFGLDTLSWSRAGAQCVGVDFAPEAIEVARDLAKESGLNARFICSDVYALPTCLDESFDIVFTSYGVLWWLADLDAWATLIARYLKPGGRFYIVEFHPLLYALDDAGATITGDYFRRDSPVCDVEHQSYAASEPDTTEITSFGWNHPVGDVATALLEAGLILDHVHEHDTSPYDCFPFTVPSSDGRPDRFVVSGREGRIPMLFSIQARAPVEPATARSR